MSKKKELQRKTKISVAIVLYNPSVNDIAQCFKNIKILSAIDLYDFDFYLIDNASTNDNDKVIGQYKLDFAIQNLTYIKLSQNKGFGAGHNSILEKLNSDFHIIMNPDIDINDKIGFISAISYLISHKDVFLLSPLVRNKKDGNIQYLNRKEPTVFDLAIRLLGPHFFPKRQATFVKRETGYDSIQTEENATGSFMVVKTSVFKEIGGFDPKFFMYFEDTDLTKRVSEKGKVIFYPSLTVFHGWKRENHTLKGLLPMVNSMIIYFNKWGWQWL